jgi:hypothetical protein
MLSNVKELYAVDCLRADGYPVRFARLGMLNPATPIHILILCWIMEFLVYVAFYVPRWRGMAAIMFYVAYLAIVATV